MAHTAPKTQNAFDRYVGQASSTVLYADSRQVTLSRKGFTEQWDKRDGKWHLAGFS